MNSMISIIIPIYNAEKYLWKCLYSLQSLLKIDVEIILIDDGSEDDSLVICKKIEKYSPYIKVLHQENSGVSSARNLGIRVATGEYITFLDADDWLNSEILEMYIKHIRTTGKYDLYIYGYNIVKDNIVTSISMPKSNEINDYNEAIGLLLGTSRLNPCWAKLYSIEIIRRYQLFFNENLQYGEDFEFVINYIEKVKTVKFLPEFLINYQQIPTSAMHTFKFQKRLSDFKHLYILRTTALIRLEFRDNYMDSILVHHFSALTSLLLDMQIYTQYSKCLEYIMKIRNDEFFKSLFRSIPVNRLSFLKKVEYVIVSNSTFLTYIWFRVKKLVLLQRVVMINRDKSV